MDSLPSGNTKDQLFLAAVKVFAQKGYRGATVREICSLAGAANINSINYYFGGKERLYKSILENIFSEYQKRKDRQKKIKKRKGMPKKRLKDFIYTYCDMLYNNGDIAADLSGIFIAEMARPSSYLDEMAKRYMVPQAEELTGIIRDILGKKTSLNIIRDCGVSIIGAIGYYGFTWPLLSRIYSDLPSMQSYHTHLADHVFRFSMGGLKVVRKASAQEQMTHTRGKRTKAKGKKKRKSSKSKKLKIKSKK
jgi:AcrR family transcriptional regulator